MLAAAVGKSTEFFDRHCASVYESFLHRGIDPAGAKFCRNLLAGNARWEDPTIVVLGSAEYLMVRGGGTNTGFVEALYADLLGRSPSESDSAHWTGLLSGGATRAIVGASVLQSAEARTLQLQSMYQDLLARPLDDPGRTFWLGFFAAPGNGEREVTQLVLSSAEYVGLFRT